MSSAEPTLANIHINTDRPMLRPQRPPPPPSKQVEPLSPSTHQKNMLIELEDAPFSMQVSNEDAPPSLLLQFKTLFDSFDYKTVRQKILDREMINCPFTTVLWRIFLNCLPHDSSQWIQMIDASREKYNELFNKYYIDLNKIRQYNIDVQNDNHPLSQADNSPWNQYYQSNDLKENIYQDVIRTCQEMSFFQQKHVLSLLLNVLYIHSRHNEESSPYRQGMHEILAIIVHLLDLETTKVNECIESNELMKKLYDPEYLAHDAYSIYEKIMVHLQPYYDFKTNNTVGRKAININSSRHMTFQRSLDAHHEPINDTVMRVTLIYKRLKQYDLALYHKLNSFNIEPTVYGIRWLRLLFGREVPFDYIPNLWTLIFCHDENFKFVDYFFLALLMEIGHELDKNGTSEYSYYLQHLMQQNIVSNVESIIQNALILEKIARNKEFMHRSPHLAVERANNRGMSTHTERSNLSAMPIGHSIQADLMKINLFSRSSRMNKSAALHMETGDEMQVSPGKKTRDLFEKNIKMQASCAQFMNIFIDRIRSRVADLPRPNDELLLHLNGLKQIAKILDGTITFDDRSLNALLNYRSKDALATTDTDETV